MPWTTRFRCRISKNFHEDETEIEKQIAGRNCQISSGGGGPFKKSNWIIFKFTDFESEKEANSFGVRFSNAILLASILHGTGIDPGEDAATSGFADSVSAAVAQVGGKLLQNVHGLMAYESDGNEVFFEFSASGTVTQNTDTFLSSVAESFMKLPTIGTLETLALRLLALSKISPDPLAQAALAISAVEALSACPPWTPDQQRLIAKLKAEALATDDVPADEKSEVASALDRLFRDSIRQSIKRKMKSLGLTQSDWKDFDEVYNLRSRVFHGKTSGRENYLDLSSKAGDICAKIVIASIGI
ncbi:hypothetical protein [Xanthobacter autotrophicus]|uniref:hypothetical protein n=1 Tax=Xanthobacter autotrophicus TaxID=280 RepID=UPI00372BC209